MGLAILPGTAEGEVLALSEGLSFWGGVDPATGRIIDAQHPQCGEGIAGRVLMMPTSRGSCSGSGLLLDLALQGLAPAALIFGEAESILTLGAMIAGRLFGRPLPVLRLAPGDGERLAAAGRVRIEPGRISGAGLSLPLAPLPLAHLDLTAEERAMRDGARGEAARIAMETVIAMAAIQGAESLVPVSRVHVDGTILTGEGNLRFAEAMAARGARVAVPTTINAISVDRDRWQGQGVPPDFGRRASRLADAYIAMGAEPTFTCSPYQLPDPPARGEVIGWSESNAVIHANSVLGARTEKIPDYLDLMIALTGRAPRTGAYLDAGRRAALSIRVDLPEGADDAAWPLIGWLAGRLAPDRIPLLLGLEGTAPDPDDLRGLCAAFGTTSAAPMLHLAGLTPEAEGALLPGAEERRIGRADLAAAWHAFDHGPETVDLVAIGSPHASAEEARAIAAALAGRQVAEGVALILTVGPATRAALAADGTLARLEGAGARVLSDLCWCSITEPLFPPGARHVLTNSGKYAHYGPGLSGRTVRYAGRAACVEAAVTGRAAPGLPVWLQ